MEYGGRNMILFLLSWSLLLTHAGAKQDYALPANNAQRVRREVPLACSVGTTSKIADFIHHVGLSTAGKPTAAALVVVMDRSAQIGKLDFYTRLKPVVRALLMQYAVIEKDCVQLSVITFGSSVTTEMDYITNPSASATKCTILEGGSSSPTAWDRIHYKTDDAEDSNIKGALETAKSMLDRTRGRTKIILLLTNGIYENDYNPSQIVQMLRPGGCKIYVVGLGNVVNGYVLQGMASPGYYGSLSEWRQLLDVCKSGFQSGYYHVYEPLASYMCEQGAGCAAGFSCTCNIVSGHAQCVCPKGYEMTSNQCTPCVRDTYKSYYGPQKCSPCPPWLTKTNNMASTDRTDCVCRIAGCDISSVAFTCEVDPCQGTGRQCRYSSSNSNNYVCDTCNVGFYSSTCQNIDDCDINNCQNGATCLDAAADSICVCPPGFRGRFCQYNINECVATMCENGGVCKDDINSFSCLCRAGYTGIYCQTHNGATTTTTTRGAGGSTTSGNGVSPSNGVVPLPSLKPSEDSTLLVIVAVSVVAAVVLFVLVAVGVYLFSRRP